MALPLCAWARLAQVLALVEESGKWPASLVHWRLCFLPKDTSTGAGTQVLKTRPLAIGPLSIGFGLSTGLWTLCCLPADCLAQCQAGALSGHDAETLLIDFVHTTSESSHPFGCSLNYQKAFDSCDHQTCITLLKRIGVATHILKALEGMWCSQIRRLTYGRLVHRDPVHHSHALLQGDAWAPLAMCLLLSGPRKQAQMAVPSSETALYMDDRSAVHTSIENLRLRLDCWRNFELNFGGRLQTHPGKTQYWGWTPQALRQLALAGFQAKKYMVVLGTCLGRRHRALTKEETDRQAASWRVEDRYPSCVAQA